MQFFKLLSVLMCECTYVCECVSMCENVRVCVY